MAYQCVKRPQSIRRGLGIFSWRKGRLAKKGRGGVGEESGFSVPHARPVGLTTKIREHQMMGSGALDMACSMFPVASLELEKVCFLLGSWSDACRE
jgi:hypothetical protein